MPTTGIQLAHRLAQHAVCSFSMTSSRRLAWRGVTPHKQGPESKCDRWWVPLRVHLSLWKKQGTFQGTTLFWSNSFNVLQGQGSWLICALKLNKGTNKWWEGSTDKWGFSLWFILCNNSAIKMKQTCRKVTFSLCGWIKFNLPVSSLPLKSKATVFLRVSSN